MKISGTDHTEFHDPGEAESLRKSQVSLTAVHEQLKRILLDPLFHNRKRLSEFLTYIVEKTLAGHHDALKERIIGIEVFERRPDFDTNLESIVRVSATELRKRLARYYENPEHSNELRIDVPARSYVATFEPAREISKRAQSRKSGFRFRRAYLLLLAGVAIALSSLWVAQRTRHPESAIDRFWSPIINSGASNRVFISIAKPGEYPPAQSQEQSTQPQKQNTADTGSEISLGEFIAHQSNYPIADLSSANAIASFLSKHGKEGVIRISGSITLADLHQAPVVVLGSLSNEWLVRLGGGLRYRIRVEDQSRLRWIEDSNNLASRDWKVDVAEPYDQVTSEYVLVTRSMDGTTGQWWVGIGGLTVLGTIAGQQLIMDPAAMEQLAAQLPKDWDSKNLQIVIEMRMVNGSLGASRVVATNTW